MQFFYSYANARTIVLYVLDWIKCSHQSYSAKVWFRPVTLKAYHCSTFFDKVITKTWKFHAYENNQISKFSLWWRKWFQQRLSYSNRVFQYLKSRIMQAMRTVGHIGHAKSLNLLREWNFSLSYWIWSRLCNGKWIEYWYWYRYNLRQW